MSTVPAGLNGRGVAIIGMAGVFPGARNLEQYWENILAKRDCVSDPPPEWGADFYLDAEHWENNRVYCAKGGYLKELAEFDAVENGVMPKSVDGTEPDHFLALRAAREALADAGYGKELPQRQRTEVIVGRGTYVNRGNATVIQHAIVVDQVVRILKQLHPEHPESELKEIRKQLLDSLPPFNSETSAGLVPNIITGRVANRLDLMGPNYIVDAACASSLVAVDLAMRDLVTGRCDLAIAGGVHASTPPPIVMIFCQLNAISKSGSIRPFDANADGTLLGEGVGMVVLKRVEDAERDGDRIYAVLRGVGTASDGKALGLLAPRLEGEELALRRAYEAAGVDPATVGLIEAHGTATTVGDATEVQALNNVFGKRSSSEPTCALGSVKSMISHLMPASGIAGLIKTALALHHKVLPPTIHCETPNPKLELETSRFYLNSEARPWIHPLGGTPRRAGVNAFGFGGINAHAVLEEHCGRSAHRPASLQKHWDAELFVLSAGNREALREQAESLRRSLEANPAVSFPDLAYTVTASASLLECRLAIVASSVDDLMEKLARAAAKLADPKTRRIKEISGIYYFSQPLGASGKVAFVFPGEGSQYSGMLADLAMHFPEVREEFDLVDGAFEKHPRGFLPSQVVFPAPVPESQRESARGQRQIWDMDSGAEAVFTANQALSRLLRDRLGIRPAAMCGHSTGEHSAILSAQAVVAESDAEVIEHILGVNAVYEDLQKNGEIPHGTLVAVGGADRKLLESLVEAGNGQLHIAMDNCPHQVVICGRDEAIENAVKVLEESRAICQRLSFSRAYHTPWFEVFCEPLLEYFKRVKIGTPQTALYSCITADVMPDDPEVIRSLVAMQWAGQVRFRETVEKMYADGVRIFIEVGPRANLTGFIDDTLRKQQYLAVPSNSQHRSGMQQILHLCAQLAAHQVPLRLEGLFELRSPKKLDLPAAVPAPLPPARRVAVRGGLQPLSLPVSFRTQSKPEVARPVPDVSQPVTVSAPPPPPAQPPGGVLGMHFQNMQRFLDLQRQMMGAYLGQAAPQTPVPAVAPSATLPFVTQVESLEPGRSALAVRRLDPAEDTFLLDHTLGREISIDDPELTGVQVVPLTVTMEILAESGALLFPGKVYTGMRGLRANRWITVEQPGTTLEIAAQALDSFSARVTVRDRMAPGQPPRPFIAEAVVTFADAYPAAPSAESFALASEKPSSWTPERLYSEGMFHGPMFQAVESVTSTGSDGTVAVLRTLDRRGLLASHPDPRFLCDPVLLDAMGQVVAFWTMETLPAGTDIFPYSLSALEVFGPPPTVGTALECRVRAQLFGDRQMTSGVDLILPDGTLYCRFVGWEDRCFEQPAPFIGLRMQPRAALLASPWRGPLPASVPASQIAGARVDCFPEAFLESANGIWLKVLAHLILSRSERETWYGMTAVAKRKREWLLGRAAAKDAVRMLLRDTLGVSLCAADIEIVANAHGAPEVRGAWRESLGVSPLVSISHSGGIAVALAALDSRALLGIDIERLSGRDGSFAETAFLPNERALVEGLPPHERTEWLLRFWSAKESASKAFGRGFQNGLKSLEVTRAEFATGEVTIELRDGLLEEFPQYRNRAMTTYTVREGDYVSSVIC